MRWTSPKVCGRNRELMAIAFHCLHRHASAYLAYLTYDVTPKGYIDHIRYSSFAIAAIVYNPNASVHEFNNTIRQSLFVWLGAEYYLIDGILRYLIPHALCALFHKDILARDNIGYLLGCCLGEICKVCRSTERKVGLCYVCSLLAID